MSQKSSLLQPVNSVSEALIPDTSPRQTPAPDHSRDPRMRPPGRNPL